MPPQKRQAKRLPFDGTIQIFCARGLVEGSALDLSVGGVRMLVPKASFGCAADDGLEKMTSQLQQVLGARFLVSMKSAAGGDAVSRPVGLSRIMDDDRPGAMQLGCAFEKPLSAPDFEQLAGVPPPKEVPSDARPAALSEEADATSGGAWLRPRGVGSLVRVVLSRAGDAESRPIQGLLHGINARGARARLTLETLSDRAIDDSLTGAAGSFLQVYGDDVHLKVASGSRHLWSGGASVRGAEWMTDGDGALLITLGFSRRLRAAELVRLGLG